MKAPRSLSRSTVLTWTVGWDCPLTTGMVRRVPLPALAALMLVLAACRSDEPPEAGPPTATPGGGSTLTDGDSRGARRTATRFLDAFVAWDTATLWQMLAPETQARWTDKPTFAAFLERKFGSRALTYEIGEPRSPHGGGSMVVPIMIEFENSTDRVVGPPLVLVQIHDSMAVADAGPLGTQGPVIGSSAPMRHEVDVPILIYHHVAPALPADPKKATDTVTTVAFGAQLSWLAGNGYATITIAEFFNAFYYELPLPSKPIVLVFDDGYADVYQHAFSLLKERGFGATVAAITGAVGQPAYLTWGQVEEMSATGVEFASHSVSHGNLAAMTPDQARTELADSRRTLEQKLGRPVQFFVYPYGEPFVDGSADAQQMVLGLLSETGYAGALTTSSGPPYVSSQRSDSPYELRRIPVSGDETLERFVASLTKR